MSDIRVKYEIIQHQQPYQMLNVKKTPIIVLHINDKNTDIRYAYCLEIAFYTVCMTNIHIVPYIYIYTRIITLFL